MKTSQKIRQCRKINGLTQADLANKLHVSRKTISGWETGRSYPDTDSLIELCNIFSISTDDLLRDNRQLNQYVLQEGKAKKNLGIEEIGYCLNLILLILSYIHMFHFYGFHSGIIPILLVINIVVFLAHYSNWKSFKSKVKLMSTIIMFLAFLVVNLFSLALNDRFQHLLVPGDTVGNLGLIAGEFTLIFVITISLTIGLFFNVDRMSMKKLKG